MINGLYHYEGEIYNKGVRIPNATIDTCKLGEKYETMCYKGGIEYAVEISFTIEDAEKAYNDMLATFTKAPTKPVDRPLTGKYKKLRDDLKIALEIARRADKGEDGGTCNFDAPAIILPRWIEKKVIQAAKEAGTSAFKWDGFGQTKYVFGTPTHAQGNRNTRVAEAMESALSSLGYETFLYQAMD